MSTVHRLRTVLSTRRSALLAVTRRLTINVAAALAAITAMTSRLQGVALLLAALALGVLVWSRWSTLVGRRPENLLGAHAAARSLVVIAALAVVTDGAPGSEPTLALTALLLIVGIGVETSLRGLWTHAAASSVRVPGLARPGGLARLAAWAVPASFIGTLALVAVGGAGGVAADVDFLATLAWTVVLALGIVRAAQARGRSRAQLTAAVEALAPQALLVFSGPSGSGYQAKMWLPLLERSGLRIVVVLREAACLRDIADATTLPVVVARTMAELEASIAPSVTTAFYVNNSAKNGHAIRFGNLTHVQLLHGDSDKPSSFNPVTAMFDRIFVAGQAGIDRYAAHGVDIPESKFTIVGRPQVSGIARPIAAAAAGTTDDVAPGPRRVLYAPTWTGFYGDANYCSLPMGEQLVRALLALDDAVVTFRPHPYSRANGPSAAQIARIDALLEQDAARTGRAHVFGAAAGEGSVTDAFNDSDALVADVSSVPADYLFSGKPFVITQMTDDEPEAFEAEFPLARAGYRVQVGTADSELRDVIAEMLGDDPLRMRRADMARYYLGDVDSADYEAIFLDAARAVATAEEDVAEEGVAP